MKTFKLIPVLFVLGLTSCAPKPYFTSEIRSRVENVVPPRSLTELQYYVDRDVEIRRELSSGKTEVEEGKIKLENGKYVHIIQLKKKTPGLCTKIRPNALDISFEVGEGKFLSFVEPKNSTSTTYAISATEWNDSYGEIQYDNKTYYIQPSGSEAKLLINKSVIDRLDVDVRRMKGLKLDN